jgi:hypothetical protein
MVLLDKVQFVLCGFDLEVHTSIDANGQHTSRPIAPIETVWYQYENIY